MSSCRVENTQMKRLVFIAIPGIAGALLACPLTRVHALRQDLGGDVFERWVTAEATSR